MNNGWIITDWLLNFKGGFIRRGLSGFFMFILADLIKLDIKTLVFFVQSLLYLGYMIFFFFLFFGKKINGWFLILLLLPTTLRFSIFDKMTIGRKEIILFFIFNFFLLIQEKNLLNSFFKTFFFLMAFVGTLFHELFFFYTPYFIFASYLKCKLDNKTFNPHHSLFIISGSFLSVLVLILFGQPINNFLICDYLLSKGLNKNICSGILAFSENFTVVDVWLFAKSNNYFWYYSRNLFLSLLPFLLFIKSIKSRIISVRKFLLIFSFLFSFSLPLFLLALDWGRWIYIHLMLLMFVSTLLLKKYYFNFRSRDINKNIFSYFFLKTKNQSLNILYSLITVLVCFYFLTSWNMYHCCIK